MRHLHILFSAFVFILCFSPYTHARFGETYEESVARYKKAGYSKVQTAQIVPEYGSSKPFLVIKAGLENDSVLVATELTWLKADFDPEKPQDIVAIKQVFVGEVPQETKNADTLKCENISYIFRDGQVEEDYVQKVIGAFTGVDSEKWGKNNGLASLPPGTSCFIHFKQEDFLTAIWSPRICTLMIQDSNSGDKLEPIYKLGEKIKREKISGGLKDTGL